MKLPGSITYLFTPVAYEDDLQGQRDRILFNILLGICIVGGLLLSIALYQGIQDRNWLTIAINVFVYGCALAITFFRRIPYHLRVYSLLFAVYVLGLTSFIEDGLDGNGRLYFIAFAVITGILLGTRGAIFAIILSGATLSVVYYLRFTGRLAIPEIEPYLNTPSSISFSLVSVAAFLTVAVITTISMITLLSSLSKSVQKEKALRDEVLKERAQMDQVVVQRTQDLERRLVQIRTAAEISRTLSAVLDPGTLLQQVVNLIKAGFDLYYVGVFLLDETGQFAVLRAGTGEPGAKMVSEGHKLAVGGGSMIGWTTANKQPRIALDVGHEAVRFSNPYLPLTRSELSLPLVRGDRTLGALTIQSTQPEAFDENDIVVLQGTADSLATALENARLFRQVQGSLEEIRTLHQQYLVQAWSDVSRHEGALSYTFESGLSSEDKPVKTFELPLTLRNQTIGLVKFEGDRLSLTAEEQAFIEAVTNEAAVALENVRLLGETKRRAERERLVTEVASRVRASTEVDTVLQTAIKEAARILRASRGVIQLDIGKTAPIENKPTHSSDSGSRDVKGSF